jgi:hypothetical protein
MNGKPQAEGERASKSNACGNRFDVADANRSAQHLFIRLSAASAKMIAA